MHEVTVNWHDSQALFTIFFRKNVAQTNLTIKTPTKCAHIMA